MPIVASPATFRLPPDQAVEYFRGRGLAISDAAFRRLSARYQDYAFAVAGLRDVNLLRTLRDSLTDAISGGGSYADWLRSLPDTNALAGRRLRTIFRTNTAAALNAGQFAAIQRAVNRGEDVWIQYSAILDSRVRPSHARLDGVVARANDPFWQVNYPPNGFNCRCSAISIPAEDAREEGLRLTPQRRLRRLSDIPSPNFRIAPGRGLESVANDLLTNSISPEVWRVFAPRLAQYATSSVVGFVQAVTAGRAIRNPQSLGYIPTETAQQINAVNAQLKVGGEGTMRAFRALRRGGYSDNRARRAISQLSISQEGTYTISGAGVLTLTRRNEEFEFDRDGDDFILRTARTL